MTFEIAVRFLIHGGYGWTGEAGIWNDPAGGITKYGISQKAFPDLHIAEISEEEAISLYRVHYWAKVRADELPAPLALLLFDAAVNHGVSYAIRTLQRALGVAIDGVFGPKTLAAVRRYEGEKVFALVTDLCALRIRSYTLDDDFNDHGLGWSRRLFAVHTAAVKGEVS